MASKRPAEADFNPPRHPKFHKFSSVPDPRLNRRQSYPFTSNAPTEPTTSDLEPDDTLGRALLKLLDSNVDHVLISLDVEAASEKLRYHEGECRKFAETDSPSLYHTGQLNQRSAAQSALVDCNNRLDAVKSANKARLSELLALVPAQQTVSLDGDARLKALESRLNAQQSQMDKQKVQLQQQQLSIDEQKTRLEEKQSHIDEQKSRLDQQQSDITKLTIDNQTLHDNLTHLEQSISVLPSATALNSLRQHIYETTAPLAQVEIIEERIKQVEQANRDKSNEIDHPREDRDTPNDRLEHLEKTISAHRKLLDYLEKTIYSPDENETCIVQDIARSAKQIDMLSHEMDKLSQELDSSNNKAKTDGKACLEELGILEDRIALLEHSQGPPAPVSTQPLQDQITLVNERVNTVEEAMARAERERGAFQSQGAAIPHTPPGTPNGNKEIEDRWKDSIQQELHIAQDTLRVLQTRFDNLTTEDVVRSMCTEFDKRYGFDKQPLSLKKLLGDMINLQKSAKTADQDRKALWDRSVMAEKDIKKLERRNDHFRTHLESIPAVFEPVPGLIERTGKAEEEIEKNKQAIKDVEAKGDKNEKNIEDAVEERVKTASRLANIEKEVEEIQEASRETIKKLVTYKDATRKALKHFDKKKGKAHESKDSETTAKDKPSTVKDEAPHPEDVILIDED